LTALLFVAVYFRTGWGPALWFRDWPFVASLVAMTFIDLELRILPDKLTLPGLVLGLLTAPLAPELGIVNSVIGAVVGFSFFYGLAWLYATLRKIDGLGGGDIKLLAMLGAFIGPLGVFYTVFISSVLGSVVGILVSKKGDLMQTAIPFGPFLIVGALVYYLIWDIVIQWLPFMNLI
jgi:leader peptidase (prepilin peptidase)/N-methyltransferase